MGVVGVAVVSAVVLDLFVTGIIGLIRKEIRAKNLFFSILFLPLGLIGKISVFFFKLGDEKDTGDAAVASSIGAIALGVLLTIIFGFYYLNVYRLGRPEVMDFLVRFLLVAVIVSVPVAIVFLKKKD